MTAGLCGESVFSFIRHCQIAFQSGRAILHSLQPWMRVPAAPASGGVRFLDLGDSSRCAGYLIIALMCISLMTRDADIFSQAYVPSSLVR